MTEIKQHPSPVNAELDQVQIAFGVATTQTEIDPERRWEAIKLVSEFLGKLRIRAQQTTSEAPRFYIVNQHIGWLKQYILGMDERNWRDMQLRAERQLESLSEEIDKEEAALGIRAQCVPNRDAIAAVINDRTMINDEGFVQNSEAVADAILALTSPGCKS